MSRGSCGRWCVWPRCRVSKRRMQFEADWAHVEEWIELAGWSEHVTWLGERVLVAPEEVVRSLQRAYERQPKCAWLEWLVRGIDPDELQRWLKQAVPGAHCRGGSEMSRRVAAVGMPAVAAEGEEALVGDAEWVDGVSDFEELETVEFEAGGGDWEFYESAGLLAGWVWGHLVGDVLAAAERIDPPHLGATVEVGILTLGRSAAERLLVSGVEGGGGLGAELLQTGARITVGRALWRWRLRWSWGRGRDGRRNGAVFRSWSERRA